MGPTAATGGGGGEIPPLVGFPLPAALGAAPLLAGAVLIFMGPTAATTGGGGGEILPLAAVVLATVTPVPPLPPLDWETTAGGLVFVPPADCETAGGFEPVPPDWWETAAGLAPVLAD
jgi:hypothetical protein